MPNANPAGMHPRPPPSPGHYDVQPAMEDNWLHDPFELHSVDGWLDGRGTTDNKGAGGRRWCEVDAGWGDWGVAQVPVIRAHAMVPC